MNFEITVKRHRLSVTQGEAEVFVNGKSIVRYGDDIKMHAKYGNIIDIYGSTKPDAVFIEAAMRQYSKQIMEVVTDERR